MTTTKLTIMILTIAALLFVFVPNLSWTITAARPHGSRLRADHCCVRSSLTPNLARVFLTRVLNASSVIES